MSNALVPVGDIERMAMAVAKSGLFGMKTPDQAMALMLIAQAEGMHPAIAARDYHVIQGRPALKADAMMARFQASGGRVNWDVYTDKEVKGTFSHPQGGSVTLGWSIDQAKKAGLTGKDNWDKYPRAMLRARVISEGIRTVFPGSVVGVYTPEEVQDFDDKPKTKHMGAVEEVVAEVEQAVSQQEDGAFALYVPGSTEAYSRHHSKEEWRDAFMSMATRVVNSSKFKVSEKLVKLKALRENNDEVISTLPQDQQDTLADYLRAASIGISDPSMEATA